MSHALIDLVQSDDLLDFGQNLGCFGQSLLEVVLVCCLVLNAAKLSSGELFSGFFGTWRLWMRVLSTALNPFMSRSFGLLPELISGCLSAEEVRFEVFSVGVALG